MEVVEFGDNNQGISKFWGCHQLPTPHSLSQLENYTIIKEEPSLF